MELIKDVIKIDNRIDFGKHQTYIESEIVIPTEKPDIHEIIKNEGFISIKKVEMGDGKAICKGNFNYNVIYMTEGKNEVLNIAGKIDLNDVIEKENIVSDMESMLYAEIEYIDCSILNDRKIKMSALINIKGSMFEKDRIDIVKDVSQVESIQKHRKEISYQDIVGIEKAESIIKDTTPINREEVKSIISVNPYVKIKDTRISENKVKVSGILEINPLACTYDGEVIELDKVGIEFTQYIEVIGAYEGMKEEINTWLENMDYEFRQNEESNSGLLEIECSICSKAKVTDEITREVLEDAYSPQKIVKFDHKQVDVNKLISSEYDSFIIREGIKNNAEDVQIKDIVSVCSSISIENTYVDDCKSVIQGIVKVDILYVPVEGERLVYKISQELPFEDELEVKMLDETCKVFNTITIEKFDVDLSKDEIDLTIKVKRYTEVISKKTESFITKGEDLGDYDLSSSPSLIVYICRDKETLWDIAKKYHTTEEEISLLNDISNDDELKPGKCLIIEKKIMMCE